MADISKIQVPGSATQYNIKDAQARRDIEDVKADLGALVPTDLAKGTTYTSEKYVDYSNGRLTNSSVSKATDYIDVSAYASIVYSRIGVTSSSSYWGIAFYDAEKNFISGQRVALKQESSHYILTTIAVPENGNYIRLTALPSIGEIKLYDLQDYNTKVYSKIENLESNYTSVAFNLNSINEFINETTTNGYFHLPAEKWKQGGWQTYNSPQSRLFRVRYNEALTFDRDIFILADTGFYVEGFYSDGTAITYNTIVKIEAGRTFKIDCRRIAEDTTETADVELFANKITISTALAPIELYNPTFTDVSMFERIGIGGDSYSAGGGIISGIRPLTWGKNLERQAWVTVDIYARSGENVVEWVTDQTNGLPALLAGEECGLYWLWHGINGTSSASALGTPEDMSTSPHPATFYGQYVEAIEQIKATFPNARIVIATITGSSFGNSESLYRNANTAIRAIAEYCNVPLIDITEDDFYKSLWYSDNIRSSHPTAMLAAGMAMANRRLISKCIQNNPDYFINYGTNN